VGHIRLGKLPRGRKWKQVVELLRTGGSVDELAAATAHAAEREIASAKNDPVFAQAVWLLTQLPLAARSPDYEEQLAALGIAPGAEQSPLALIAAASHAIDRGGPESPGRTDLGDLARQAATESLAAFLTSKGPGFFDTPADALKRELARLGTKANFAALARDFFARLTLKTIEYYVSRELPNHIGQGGSLASIDHQIAFRQALEQHCREASLIVEAFAGGWYSKASYEGTLSPVAAQRFAAYALTKMHDELRARRAADG
jgi:hypothetical protein